MTTFDPTSTASTLAGVQRFSSVQGPDGPRSAEELDRSLAVLVAAQDQERALPDDHMNRCFTALYILQSSLDFEKGGDLAGSLFQIYEYARLQVLKAFRKELDADLEQAKLAIDGIRSAWAEIEDQV